MINSKQIRSALLYFFGFHRGMIVGTEVSCPNGAFISDLICLPKKKEDKRIIEIEIKISKQDLLKDFESKQLKHTLGLPRIDKYPNVFYFCVPEELVEFTKELLIEKNKKEYGIICYKEKWIESENKKEEYLILEDCVKIIKNAKQLRKIENYEIDMYKEFILRRNTNDIIGFNKEVVWNTNRYKKILREKNI